MNWSVVQLGLRLGWSDGAVLPARVDPYRRRRCSEPSSALASIRRLPVADSAAHYPCDLCDGWVSEDVFTPLQLEHRRWLCAVLVFGYNSVHGVVSVSCLSPAAACIVQDKILHIRCSASSARISRAPSFRQTTHSLMGMLRIIQRLRATSSSISPTSPPV